MIFSLAWNIIFCDNLNVLVLNFLEMKNMVFLSQKVYRNRFTDYWKVFVLTFSEIGNTVFSWAKKLTEIYLLITWNFVFWTFWWWEIRSFFWAKKLMERWYLHGFFFSFLWYSRTWEIWFFAQRRLLKSQPLKNPCSQVRSFFFFFPFSKEVRILIKTKKGWWHCFVL